MRQLQLWSRHWKITNVLYLPISFSSFKSSIVKNCGEKKRDKCKIKTIRAIEDMQPAPVDTLPLILSVALLFIAGCVSRLILRNVFVSPSSRWRHVVRLWSGGASIPQYGVYQHWPSQTYSFRGSWDFRVKSQINRQYRECWVHLYMSSYGN